MNLSCMALTAQENNFEALRKQGFELHQQSRFADAIPLLKRACRLEPGDYFANLLLGTDLLRVHKSTEAVEHLEIAAHAKPDEIIAQITLAEAEADLGHFAQAAETYQQALALGHGSEQSLQPWADFALQRIGQISASQRASSPAPDAARSAGQGAAAQAGVPACQELIPAMERKLAVSQRRPANSKSDTAYALSICYASTAWRAVASMRAEGENPSRLHRLRGDVLLRLKGDAEAAALEYKRALAAHPGDPELLERLAEAQLATGDRDSAQQSALASLAIDPDQRDAMRTLASLAMSNRDYEQALPWLRQLFTQSPADRSLQVELATALAQTGHAADALQQLASALGAGYPDEKGALHSLEARLLRQLGRDAEAAKSVIEARRLSDAYQQRRREGRPNGDQ